MPKKTDFYKSVKKTNTLPFSTKHIKVLEVGKSESKINIYDSYGQCAENVTVPNNIIDDNSVFNLDPETIFIPITLVLDEKKKELSVSTKVFGNRDEAKKSFGEGLFCWNPQVMSDGTLKCSDPAFVKKYKTIFGL